MMSGVLHRLLTRYDGDKGEKTGAVAVHQTPVLLGPDEALPQRTADGLSGQESCEVLTLALRGTAQPAVHLNVRLENKAIYVTKPLRKREHNPIRTQQKTEVVPSFPQAIVRPVDRR
jgi:hypothetical protein